jgi:hypothetical protein
LERPYWATAFTSTPQPIGATLLPQTAEPLLGRGLKPEEVREVTQMARRIAAILLLEPQLDANYQAIKADTYDWQSSKDST